MRNRRVIFVLVAIAVPTVAGWLYVAKHMPARYIVVEILLCSAVSVGIAWLQNRLTATSERAPYINRVLDIVWALILFVIFYVFAIYTPMI